MFDKMKQLIQMQNKMQEAKRELENISFEIVSSDGLVKITMNGAQEIKGVVIAGSVKDTENTALENAIKDAYNRAIKRSHEIASKKMKDIVGFNFPGL